MNISKKSKRSIDDTAPQETSVKGHIDLISYGFAYGWAYDPSAEDRPTKVTLGTDVAILGTSEANYFRDDLQKAGIGDGKCGFKIPLDELIKAHTGEPLSLTINNTKLENAISIDKPIDNYSGSFVRVDGSNVIIKINSTSPQQNKKIVLLQEDKVIVTQQVNFSAGENHLTIRVPSHLFDDNYHLLRLGITGYPFSVATATLQFKAILTPWQYLKKSCKEPGFIALSDQSKHRYESLALQLGALKEGKLVTDLTMEAVMAAHDVMVEGWSGRKKYPVLTLPKFDKPEVSIIIPAYNKFELTYHCIASIILAYNETSYEVIVADDCSDDETEQLSDYVKNAVHVRNPENLRFLLSCNNAALSAKGKYLIFLNNDTEVTSRWIDELLLPYAADSSVGSTGSKLLNLDGSLQDAGGIIWGNGQPWNVGGGLSPMAPEFNYNRQADYLTGAALCIPIDVWKEVKGFSEEYAPCYYEDTDIAFKIRAEGYKTIYCPFSQVIHFEGQSHGKDVTKGLKRYQKVNESKFKSKWLQEYKHNGTVGVDLLLQKDRGINHRVLVIDYATPDSSADAGSYAAIQEMQLLVGLGMKVTFVPENMAHMGKLTTKLQRMGIEVLYAPFYNSVYDVIEQRGSEFSAAYITRYSVAEKYIDAIRHHSNAKIVFNNADLHFLRQIRAALSTGEYSMEAAIATRDAELGTMRKVDAILSYNETEHAVIASHNLKIDNVFRCPWVLTEKLKGKPFEEREGIAFLGGFNHHPNIEAVKYFIKDVMPILLEQDPDLRFYVYGSNPPEILEELASDNVIIHGFVENLDDVFYNHKVIVAPLISGAGIKGKVLEAMSYGAPQVLTKVASEATGLSHQISAWISDRPEELAQGVLELSSNKELWEKFSENSKILMREMYSKEKGLDMMREIFMYIDIYT